MDVIGKVILVYVALLPWMSWADQFHYNNVLIGDRAMGLGGAFTAVADDASGVFYNPAGLAFALSNDISGSANAFYKRRVVYKETIGDEDFTENSEGSMAPFFGGLQKLDNIYPGLVFAFGIYSIDSELKDQDDLIENPSLYIERFHRTVNIRASTTAFSGALAKRFGGGLSFGLGAAYLTADELVQEYQDALTMVNQGGVLVTTNGGTSAILRLLNQNIRQRLMVSALEVSLGVQWAFLGRLSIGANIKTRTVMSQEWENGQETTVGYVDNNYKVVKDEDIPSSAGAGLISRNVVEPDTINENPVGGWPSELRFGVAYFATTRLLLSMDAIRYGESKGDIPLYHRESVTNFAFGGEYYITPAVPVRLGLFQNNDARPEVKSGEVNQPDHIDYTGFSLFFAWVQPNSQISIGSVYQKGIGKAQKISSQPRMQDVEAISSTVAFSATHSF